jgi:hypothetical protein
VAGLTILAEMGIYIIDSSLNRPFVKTIPFVKSTCPYPALYSDSAKRMNCALFISLHYYADWSGNIFCQKVHVIRANNKGIDSLVEPDRLSVNGLFDNLPLMKGKSHRFFCERPHVRGGK